MRYDARRWDFESPILWSDDIPNETTRQRIEWLRAASTLPWVEFDKEAFDGDPDRFSTELDTTIHACLFLPKAERSAVFYASIEPCWKIRVAKWLPIVRSDPLAVLLVQHYRVIPMTDPWLHRLLQIRSAADKAIELLVLDPLLYRTYLRYFECISQYSSSQHQRMLWDKFGLRSATPHEKRMIQVRRSSIGLEHIDGEPGRRTTE
jgi:hypothetical protein